ncbi:hypothetical protein [Cellulomonas sp. SG140]|uniref:hypothetical protein n=1 Tax=Cellulomonas sp. SG140 TaxID=2976536 RepID=UPI0021E82E9F|nr:hypothetical protein [Cellulomonas sp. SG140]
MLTAQVNRTPRRPHPPPKSTARAAVRGAVDVKYREDEDKPRHPFSGQLVARMTDGRAVRYNGRAAEHLRALAEQIMGSRVRAASGGPIAYLEPVQAAD